MKRVWSALLFAVGAVGQIPAPQINLTGNIGCQGFPCANSGTLSLSAAANHTMTAQETSAFSFKIVSTTTLTAPRALVMPGGRFSLGCVENLTTGGQPITIIGPSGTGVSIPNGQTICGIWNDGTNYVTTATAGSTTLTGDVTGSGIGTFPTTLVNKTISINSTSCTLGSSCTLALGNLPTYNSGGTIQAVHAVIGTVTASGVGIGVTLSGSSVYTSSTSYHCFTTMTDATPAPPAIPVNNTNGTQFNIAADTAGGYTGTIGYFCIGN